MKKFQKIIVAFFLIGIAGACTSDFDEINTNPTRIEAEQATAAYFFTKPQYKLFAPDRYPYWRAQLIHADRFAGHFTFGFNGSWWTDGLGYTYNSGYTDAAFDWLNGAYGDIGLFLDLTGTEGELENEYMYAMGLILKGIYFQMYTDTFGEIPYTDAGNPDVLPAFDTQSTIYQGIIAELETAMSIIGDATITGDGVQDIGANDLFYSGDLQKWKKLANTLKLRMAMRAYGADGASFAATEITEALASDLLGEGDDALIEKDNEISQWNAAAYGDVWHNFGGLGSKWRVGKPLIDYLRNNNDPRLSVYAKPAVGGELLLPVPEDAVEQKAYDLMLQNLTDAGVVYTEEDVTVDDIDQKKITMPEGSAYVGQPVRLNGFAYSFAHANFFSEPAENIVQEKNAGEIFNEVAFSAAESFFLQAEAAVLGLSSGDANALFQEGIRQSMMMWGVGDADITTYLTGEAEATLSGTTDDMLEQIYTQKWVAQYTDGFEAWANVRKSGYPSVLADGITDSDIYESGSLNGAYPQRMRYGNSIRNTNGTNLDAAIARQGEDLQGTKLWWAK
ncbi:SusD/RagB family nutrient-binding outer membrane lipoprotein [Reichenbachiella sp.]|uniref:SusD/RagB family nutrient-binding outer membrane lipoprotein n=1 Tax=Reichenbachiella sp. TaxID=2184521 RepID=UPI003BAE25C4